MAKKKKKSHIILIVALFLVYFIFAARPVPRETILTPGWINSLETEEPALFKTPAELSANKALFPFTLGYRFGYIDSSGQLAINRIKSGDIYLSPNMWTEFPPEPASIEVKNIEGETIINIDNPRGYPFILDNRIFILGSEQNSLSEVDRNGNIMWTYEFGSILTDIDVAAGLVVAVSVDGVMEILDSQGKRVYFFQPGGSRLEAIYGCAISRDGARIGLISGYDPQRFLLLERFGAEEGEYRVVTHEFLDSGFRRSARVLFIDDDSRVVYERQGGLNCYNIKSRRNVFIPLDGEIAAIDKSGDRGMLFLITRTQNQPMQKNLIGIKLPSRNSVSALNNAVFLKAPFKSEDVYLERKKLQSSQSMLIVGGGGALISFNLEER